jgi:hypothetical protein
MDIVDTMANNTLRTITLASSILHCTVLTVFLRFAQNGFTSGVQGDSTQPCPLCGAQAAARLSHVLNCGGLWVFLAEECPGLGWDYSASDRWQLLFGTQVTTNDSAAQLCLAWDCIQAGFNAGRFGRVGVEGCLSRLVALVNRPGTTGQLARTLLQPPPPPLV